MRSLDRRALTRLAIGSAVLAGALVAAPLGAAAIPVPVEEPGDPPATTTTFPSPTTTTPGGGGGGGGGGGACVKTWASPPRIVIHDGGLTGGGGSVNDIAPLQDAIREVNAEFNRVGGTSAAVGATSAVGGTFTFGQWLTDPSPTIHVGFAPVSQGTGITLVEPSSDCHVYEAHIMFDDHDTLGLVSQTWDWETPDAIEEALSWRDAVGEDRLWFRPLWLHELLHAFGQSHSATTYSFMNYPNTDGFPWANREPDEMIRPLPADIRLLRSRYPAAGSRAEVGLLATYFDSGTTSNGAAYQEQLCAPSLGATWSAVTSEGTCGLDGSAQGSTSVCTGDLLKTRATFVNYSTTGVDVWMSAFFSRDATFSGFGGADVFSTTPAVEIDLAGTAAWLQSRQWEVPDLDPGEWHVGLHVLGTTDSGVAVEDWIPLSGTVESC
jgi:hypothetical protein